MLFTYSLKKDCANKIIFKKEKTPQTMQLINANQNALQCKDFTRNTLCSEKLVWTRNKLHPSLLFYIYPFRAFVLFDRRHVGGDCRPVTSLPSGTISVMACYMCMCHL